jgi:hypothetical protein
MLVSHRRAQNPGHLRARTVTAAGTVLAALAASVLCAAPAQAATGRANCHIAHQNGGYYPCYSDHITVFAKPRQSLYLKANHPVTVIVYGQGDLSDKVSSEIRLRANVKKWVYTNRASRKKAVEFEVSNTGAPNRPEDVTVKWCTVSEGQLCGM